jgi:hypothetical protein
MTGHAPWKRVWLGGMSIILLDKCGIRPSHSVMLLYAVSATTVEFVVPIAWAFRRVIDWI